jgi:hypothetical protein
MSKYVLLCCLLSTIGAMALLHCLQVFAPALIAALSFFLWGIVAGYMIRESKGG